MFGNDFLRLLKRIIGCEETGAQNEVDINHIINGAEVVPDETGVIHVPNWANRMIFTGYVEGTVDTSTQITMTDKNDKNVCRATIANGKQYNIIEGILHFDRINKKCIERVYNAGFTSLPSTTNTLNANSTFFGGLAEYDFSELKWSGVPAGVSFENMKYSVYA